MTSVTNWVLKVTPLRQGGVVSRCELAPLVWCHRGRTQVFYVCAGTGARTRPFPEAQHLLSGLVYLGPSLSLFDFS